MPKQSIIALRGVEKQIFAYRYAMNCIDYDSETVAPAESADGRAEAMEVLTRQQFDCITSDTTAALLEQAAADAETEQEQAEVRELRRRRDEICNIPAEEYAAFGKLTQQSLSAWLKARKANDYSVFEPYLQKVVDARRSQAKYIDPSRSPYEVWLDQFERGLTIEKCETFFAQLREVIVPLLADIKKCGSKIRTDFLIQDWALPQQEKLSRFIMDLWGLDGDHCILGETEHPFTTDFWRGDVRITTNYKPDNMVSSMYSVAHEGGHALYELNISPDLDFTILAGGSTMGVHESQSRLFENYVGRSRGFVHFIWPKLLELFPAQLANVTEEEFYRAVNCAEPDFIRTEADELTYPLHIMVRYETEKALMEGRLTAAEMPAFWNAKYKEYLGLDVPDDVHGCLQDIHWSMGDIGYFPSYALGSAYGAQAMADLRKSMPLDEQLAQGNLAPLRQTLTERVWQYGCLKEPQWLVRSLCGGEFDTKYYVEYLKKKYSELYHLA